jgi:Tol biopolymer transport system component
VYPVADGEEWILFDAPAHDPGEPEPHDALFLVRPDGSGLHRLVHEMTGSEVRATWSADGSQVAYIQTRWPRDTGPDAGIWVVSADGSDAHRVYECTKDDAPIADLRICDYLDWGVDGAIYVGIQSNFTDANSPPRTFEIWRIDPATGEGRAVLTREDAMTVEQPRVSPDGTQLVYARERIADGKWAIFAADMAGGSERQLTDWDLYAAYPDWSADGRLISFNTNDLRVRNDQPHQVCTVRFGGVPPRNPDCIETHDPDAPGVTVQAAHARWTPDGRGMTYSLLLRGEAYLSVMNHDGSDQRLVPGPVWGTFSELRPVTR